MENGTIIHIPYKKSSSFWINVVQKLIMKVSGSDLVHSRVYLDGFIYESTPGIGFKKSEFSVLNPRYYIGIPIKEMTPKEVTSQIFWWNHHIDNKSGYNYVRLFTCIILAWTKPFWNFIKYVPWSNGIFGEFCSSAVDLAFRHIGWDLLPDQQEKLTSPGDLLKSKYHKVEKK